MHPYHTGRYIGAFFGGLSSAWTPPPTMSTQVFRASQQLSSSGRVLQERRPSLGAPSLAKLLLCMDDVGLPGGPGGGLLRLVGEKR